MEDKYFKELYDCKKELLNELLVMRRIVDALSYSGVFDLRDKRINELKKDLENMEVDITE